MYLGAWDEGVLKGSEGVLGIGEVGRGAGV